jgi:hypothetical protein
MQWAVVCFQSTNFTNTGPGQTQPKTSVPAGGWSPDEPLLDAVRTNLSVQSIRFVLCKPRTAFDLLATTSRMQFTKTGYGQRPDSSQGLNSKRNRYRARCQTQASSADTRYILSAYDSDGPREFPPHPSAKLSELGAKLLGLERW